MLKRTLAGLALIFCIGALSLSASALAQDGKTKQCSGQKVAQVTSKSQCSKAAAAKVAQVTSDGQARCAAAKAARVAQVKSGIDCPHAFKVAQVAQIKSAKSGCCAAAAKAAQVAQVKSVAKSGCCAAAAKAAQVAQVKSDAAPQCAATAQAARVAQVKSEACAAKCAAAKAAQVAQVKSGGALACCGACNGAKAVQAKYVAFGCSKTDAAVRKAAYAYLKAVAQMQEKIGAKGCPLEAASMTLATVVGEEMAKYQEKAASAKSAAPAVATVSLGSVSECGPDCTKACCTK